MAITVTCSCGKRHSVDNNLAGTRCMCPACGAMFTFPRPQDSSRDEVTEQACNSAGEPATKDPGTTVDVPLLASPCIVPLGGLPGDLRCPFCNLELNTDTGAEVGLHRKSWWRRYVFWMNWLVSYFLNLGLPLSCRDCGPIRYRLLVGESRETAEKILRNSRRRFLKFIIVVLLCIGLVAWSPALLKWWRDWREKSRLEETNAPWQEMKERNMKMKAEADQRVKFLQEMEQRRQEERDIIYNKRLRQPDAPSPPPLTPEMKAKIAPLGSPDAKPTHPEPSLFDKQTK